MLLNFYIFSLAILLALLEIQIEGREGWAKNLPAWRPHSGSLAARWYRKFMSGKELTGYHAVLLAFIFLVFLFPYAWGVRLDLFNFFKTVSLFFFFAVLWDFLWFVLNPHYSLKKFHRRHISWHLKWIGRAPADYYYGIGLSFAAAFLGSFVVGTDLLSWWIWHAAAFGLEVIITVLFTLYILKIDTWIRDN